MSEDRKVPKPKKKKGQYFKKIFQEMHLHLKIKANISSNNQACVACCRDGITWQTVLECINNLQLPTILQLPSSSSNYFPIKSFRCCHIPKLQTSLILCLVTQKNENCTFVRIWVWCQVKTGVYAEFNTELLVECGFTYFSFAHHQLFPQSPDEISELPNFCECFKLSTSDRVKRASSAPAFSLILSILLQDSCNTTAVQFTSKLSLNIYQANINCLRQKLLWLFVHPAILERQSE